MRSLRSWAFTVAAAFVLFATGAFCGAGIVAKDLRLDARLIVGTDAAASPAAKQKPVDADLSKALRKAFRWKNYFEDNRQSASIPLNGRKRISFGHDTEIEVVNLGGDRVEVMLYLCGKAATKSAHTLSEKEWLTLGGADKNNTAWFVVLRRNAD
jgi:hypothetical protein